MVTGLALDFFVAHDSGIDGSPADVTVEIRIGLENPIEAVGEGVVPLGAVEQLPTLFPGVLFDGDVSVPPKGIGPFLDIDVLFCLGFHPQFQAGHAVVAHQRRVVFLLRLVGCPGLDVHPFGTASGVVVASPKPGLLFRAFCDQLDRLSPGPLLCFECVSIVGFGIVLRVALEGEQVVLASVPARI